MSQSSWVDHSSARCCSSGRLGLSWFFFLFFLISKDQLGQHAFHHSYIIRDGTNMTFFFHAASHRCHIISSAKEEKYPARRTERRHPQCDFHRSPARFRKPPGAQSLLSVLRVFLSWRWCKSSGEERPAEGGIHSHTRLAGRTQPHSAAALTSSVERCSTCTCTVLTLDFS